MIKEEFVMVQLDMQNRNANILVELKSKGCGCLSTALYFICVEGDILL